MSILAELNLILETLNIAIETGSFSKKVPDEYIVITPLSDTFEIYADNKPLYETQEARLSLFSKGNYLQRKNQIIKILIASDFIIADRRYIDYENDTGYHHYSIDTAKEYYSILKNDEL